MTELEMKNDWPKRSYKGTFTIIVDYDKRYRFLSAARVYVARVN